MPWKEPGKGDKDPWNSGSQQPPDLDDVFKNLGGKVRSIFGGGGSSSDCDVAYGVATASTAANVAVPNSALLARDMCPDPVFETLQLTEDLRSDGQMLRLEFDHSP